MAFDFLLLGLFFAALFIGFVRGAVKVSRGFFALGLAWFVYALVLPAFLSFLLGTPYFMDHSPTKGGLVFFLLILLLAGIMGVGLILGRLAARGLDLFLAEAVYRFAGAFLSLFNLWLFLTALQLLLLRLFPPWAFDPNSAFQELVFAAARALTAR
jgi:hypothetical protein